MDSIHLREFHLPKGPNLFFMCVGALVCFVFALLTFVTVALGGGQAYAQQLGGWTTLLVLTFGTVAAAIGAFITRTEEQG